MKPIALLCLTTLATAGCSQLPKDGYAKDFKVTTPWGTTEIGTLATGAAARNLTESERATMLTPTKSTTPR